VFGSFLNLGPAHAKWKVARVARGGLHPYFQTAIIGTMTILIATLIATLSVSGLCSILEAVLLSIDTSYVELRRAEGRRSGHLLSELKSHIDKPIAAILTLNTVAHTAGAAFAGSLAFELFGSAWVAAFSGVFTFAILVFSEIIPKTAGARFCNQLAPSTAYVLKGLTVAMAPLVVPLSWVQKLIQGSRKSPGISREEIEVMARMAWTTGTLAEDEWQVVSNVMRLDEVPVGEVMTPRTDIVAIDAGATVEEAKEVMLDHGHLRLPVHTGSVDRIVGVLVARDLWRADQEGVTDIRDLPRAPIFAPVSRPVQGLIPELRDKGAKMVIVLDEFGGTAGLATFEDLIEEIVGEIRDEHEAHEPAEFQLLADGCVRVWGGVSVREANQRLKLDLPSDRFDTIGGFVFGSLHRVPRPGDEVPVDGGRLRVARMRGRRVEFVVFLPENVAVRKDTP